MAVDPPLSGWEAYIITAPALLPRAQVTVFNALPANWPQVSEGITIHWHGLDMRGNEFYDGVAYLQQCPIASGASFTYRFTVPRRRPPWLTDARVLMLAQALALAGRCTCGDARTAYCSGARVGLPVCCWLPEASSDGPAPWAAAGSQASSVLIWML